MFPLNVWVETLDRTHAGAKHGGARPHFPDLLPLPLLVLFHSFPFLLFVFFLPSIFHIMHAFTMFSVVIVFLLPLSRQPLSQRPLLLDSLSRLHLLLLHDDRSYNGHGRRATSMVDNVQHCICSNCYEKVATGSR